MREVPNNLLEVVNIGNSKSTAINEIGLSNLISSVIVLEPVCTKHVSTSDISPTTLANEFGKSTTCEDLKKLLHSMGMNVTVCPIRLDNIEEVFSSLNLKNACVFNLCDGCETDGYPGSSVLKYLEKYNIAFTGADTYFYDITTSKPLLKQLLLEKKVETSPYVQITKNTTIEELDAIGGYPLIVKPAISYSSIAISTKRQVIVFSGAEALEQAKNVMGVESSGDNGVFAERFLAGREYTVFVSGDKYQGITCYEAAERVFNSSLSQYERILSFEKYWDGYDLKGTIPDHKETLYHYQIAPPEDQEYLKDLAKRAYLALNGNGYGRVDIRTESMESKKAFVLEVNANCGISFNPNEFTSTTGEILRMSNIKVTDFTCELIRFAVARREQRRGQH